MMKLLGNIKKDNSDVKFKTLYDLELDDNIVIPSLRIKTARLYPDVHYFIYCKVDDTFWLNIDDCVDHLIYLDFFKAGFIYTFSVDKNRSNLHVAKELKNKDVLNDLIPLIKLIPNPKYEPTAISTRKTSIYYNHIVGIFNNRFAFGTNDGVSIEILNDLLYKEFDWV